MILGAGSFQNLQIDSVVVIFEVISSQQPAIIIAVYEEFSTNLMHFNTF